MTTINPIISYSDLQLGDIVGDETHVGIFVGQDPEKGPRFANALTGGYRGANYRSTSPVSFIGACENSTPLVYRCKRWDLALKAAELASIFSARGNIIYDFTRLEYCNSFDLKCGGFVKDRSVQDVTFDLFKTQGLFRTIKFAARRELELIQTHLSSKISLRGLRCASATILMYQMAAIEKFVIAAPKGSLFWPSNKHANLRSITCSSSSTINRYIESVNIDRFEVSDEGSVIKIPRYAYSASMCPQHMVAINTDIKYVPAINYWVGKDIASMTDQDYYDLFTKALSVDGKYVNAETLVDCLGKDNQDWDVIGTLFCEK